MSVWGDIRRHLYEYTGIDLGLAKDAEDLARLVRKHADLIGELKDLPKDQRFTSYPNPNWDHPTPVEGRSQRRVERLPGEGMRMKIRGLYFALVNMETTAKVVVGRPEQEEALEFLRHWNNDVRTGKEGAKEYSAQVDTGHHFYNLIGVWPWSFRAGLVAFRYARIEGQSTAAPVQESSPSGDDQDTGRQGLEEGA